MSLEEIITGQIDKMWEFTTKIADVIASETLKSVFFCNLLSMYINIVKHQYTRSDRVLDCKPTFISDDFTQFISDKLVYDN